MSLNKNGIGVIRVSSKRQLDGFTVETQRRMIKALCKEHNINLIGIKKYLAISGRKETTIVEYMNDLKKLIKKHNANCVVLWKTARLGRLLPEIYANSKDLVDNYVDTIYTNNLIINAESFKSFEKRAILYITFMLDESEGYSIFERMLEGKKTKKKLAGENS